MAAVSMRELRNDGGRVVDRAARGETLTVTRSGRPVAQLGPLPRPPVTAAVLLERWRGLGGVDAARLREDVDAAVDPGL